MSSFISSANTIFKLSQQQLSQNFKHFSDFLLQKNITAFYLTGSDAYLSEYVPLQENFRYYLTGFAGSTGEVLVLSHKKVFLLVDGRYYAQADLESGQNSWVTIVKVPISKSLTQILFEIIQQENIPHLGILSDRTSMQFLAKAKTFINIISPISTDSIASVINYVPFPLEDPIDIVPKELVGEDASEKINRINVLPQKAIFLSSCDDIAWLSNCRSYQLPYQSFFLSKALLTHHHLFIFIPTNIKVQDSALSQNAFTFIPCELKDLNQKMVAILNKFNIEEISYDPTTVTVHDVEIITSFKNTKTTTLTQAPVAMMKCRKSEIEIAEFKRINLLSSQAIAATIRWAKSCIKQQPCSFSELDIAHKIKSEYEQRGARSLSFSTIAGFGKNSAIIHYATPSAAITAQAGELILLDSGAYYESGFATDCTRTFVVAPEQLTPQRLQEIKQNYTHVLQAQMRVEMTFFAAGTLGNAMDNIARGFMLTKGKDFGHGLGHGIGIRVHEPGVKLSSLSQEGLFPGMVCSIEPGYYLEKNYGIRLENVVYVTPQSTYTHLPHHILSFQPLIWVGWEEELIDWSLLSPEESSYLKNYQEHCKKLGTLTMP